MIEVAVQAAPSDSRAVALLARVLMPRSDDPLAVRELYLDESGSNCRLAHAPARTTLQIAESCAVSFATYFNAFPAGYWRRWSCIESVVLHIELDGSARVDLYRSKATGAGIFLGSAVVQARGDGQAQVVEAEVSLAPFEDGGWIWFDITSETPVTLLRGGWYAPEPPPIEANITVGIPTFNRPHDCVRALAALTSDPVVDQAIGAVIVSDQGTRKVRDHPQFAEAAQRLGQRLTIHDQPNWGGSGGYSRVMFEALTTTDCQQILFMDDDIKVEPDSILRALALSRFAKSPTLVGGQMLNLQEPSHLHIMGEVIDEDVFMWTAAAHAQYDHDFSKFSLADSAELHRRIDVDFNGWWMCMIPRQVAEQLGQPLPLFIKWDDIEYGLRAQEHGYGTVTLPGAAIWHMAWSDKDDAIDWQAYFHLRNRLVVSAIYGSRGSGGLIRSSLRATMKHLLCLEYSTVAIQNQAMSDFLAGPEHIFAILESALPDIRKLREQFCDAVVLPGANVLPAPATPRRKPTEPPATPTKVAFHLVRGVLHQMTRHDPRHHGRPQLNIAAQDARWFVLSRADGVTVTTADGSGVVYRKRDRALMLRLLTRSLGRHAQVMLRYNAMRRTYQRSMSTLTSRERWREVFDQQRDCPRERTGLAVGRTADSSN